MTPSIDLPALLGGLPVRRAGPPPWPIADDDVLRALQTAYADGSWGKYHGGNVETLEQALRDYHHISFALTCASGTFAVETALRALKVGSGDEVIMAAYDFPGNFFSVHAVGALPVLVDVDAQNWNLNIEKVNEAITPKTRAVIASHLHGGIVPMRQLMSLAGEHGIAVIEDAAQCPGAIVEGKKAGTWGDVGVLSFGGSKLLTAGRGGALLTDRAEVHQRARVALVRGNHVCPLSELQAAVLLPQLQKLDERNQLRGKNVELLQREMANVPGLQMFRNKADDSNSAFYKVGIQYSADEFGLPRDKFVAAMRAEGIAFDEGFRALHVGRSARRYRRGTPLDEADRAHAGVVKLYHPILLGTANDITEIGVALRKVHEHCDSLQSIA